MRIDIEDRDVEICVYGQRVLRIGQVSDDEVINLFLLPEGDIIVSEMTPKGCTHEILVRRAGYPERPKMKPECYKCGYYNKNTKNIYKCYTPSSCPVAYDKREKRKEVEAGKRRKKNARS